MMLFTLMAERARSQSTNQDSTANNAIQLVTLGRQSFRFDNFGDVDALPGNLVEQTKHGNVNLNDFGVTVSLLKLDAVVGVTGVFDSTGAVKSMLCAGIVQPNPALGASDVVWMAGPIVV
jgi:hypothetical protein